MAKILADLCLCSSVLWKVDLASDETGRSAEEIAKQSVEGVAWLLVTAYTEMQEQRNDLKTELLKGKQKFKIWKILSTISQMEKHVQKRTLRIWPNDPLLRKLF